MAPKALLPQFLPKMGEKGWDEGVIGLPVCSALKNQKVASTAGVYEGIDWAFSGRDS